MKKILIVLCLFILCGCSTTKNNKINEEKENMKKLGYGEDTVAKIFSLSKTDISYFSDKYSIEKENLLKSEDFKEENINDYDKYLYLFDIDTTTYLVNNKIINRLNTIDIYLLYKDEFFIKENTELYLKYKDNFEDTRSLIEWVNCKCYKKYFDEAETPIMNIDPLIIVSKVYYIDDYEPEDLVYVEVPYARNTKWQLRQEAYEAFKVMYDDAVKEGLNFFITSAYRSYDYQYKLYNKYLQTDTVERVDTYSARAGYSDHQSGLTVDILKDGYVLSNESIGVTDEAKWLKENSYKYGFILRYPENKDDITGYMHESWHFRYVGKDVAKIIYEKGITFDEYYAYYIDTKQK